MSDTFKPFPRHLHGISVHFPAAVTLGLAPRISSAQQVAGSASTIAGAGDLQQPFYENHHARDNLACGRTVPLRLLHQGGARFAIRPAYWPSSLALFVPPMERGCQTPGACVRVLSRVGSFVAWHLVQDRPRALQQVSSHSRGSSDPSHVHPQHPHRSSIRLDWKSVSSRFSPCRHRHPTSASRQASKTEPHSGTKTWSTTWAQQSASIKR